MRAFPFVTLPQTPDRTGLVQALSTVTTTVEVVHDWTPWEDKNSFQVIVSHRRISHIFCSLTCVYYTWDMWRHRQWYLTKHCRRPSEIWALFQHAASLRAVLAIAFLSVRPSRAGIVSKRSWVAQCSYLVSGDIRQGSSTYSQSITCNIIDEIVWPSGIGVWELPILTEACSGLFTVRYIQ